VSTGCCAKASGCGLCDGFSAGRCGESISIFNIIFFNCLLSLIFLKALKKIPTILVIASDLRLKRHNSGQVRSTKSKRPWVIHYTEEFATKSEAFRREMFFKSFDGRKWLFEKNIISPG